MSENTGTDIPGINIEDLKLKGFKIHKLPRSVNVAVSGGRRDFFKMGLVEGDMTIGFRDKTVRIIDTALVFVNPMVPHSVVRHSRKVNGYACLFTEAFITSRIRADILKRSPLFDAGESPVIALNTEQATFFRGLFRKMLAVQDGNYPFKAELMRNCIELILHEALRIQPSPSELPFQNAAARVAHSFLDRLEMQFPVERQNEIIKLRTAQDFAASLSVHVNYLNRSLKQITGKTTSALIAERIIAEATALLHHTDWSVAEIAYVLGFEYPAYFNNVFKRITGITPNSIRKEKV